MQALTTTLLHHRVESHLARLLVSVLLAGAVAIAPGTAASSAPAQAAVADYDLPITALSPRRHRAAVTELVDRERANAGLPALRASSELRGSARAWAIVTRRHLGILSHGDFAKRARSFAFVRAGRPNTRFVGENIGFGSGGFSTPREIVRAWMSSSGHRANILRNWTFGAVWSSRSGDAVAVVQHFGRVVAE
jgi:uncharacterized protein YkwD